MTKVTTTDTARRKAARRQQAYRVRQTLGIRLVRAEVDPDLVDGLISNGLLSEGDMECPSSIARALVNAARGLCRLRHDCPG